MVGAYIHSFILAKVLGLYMILMSIIMVSRLDFYRNIVQKLDDEPVAVLAMSSFSLIFGLLLVTVHNIWAWEPYVLITILSWLIILKSVVWLAIPERMAKLSAKVYQGKAIYLSAILTALIGVLVLSYSTCFVSLFD